MPSFVVIRSRQIGSDLATRKSDKVYSFIWIADSFSATNQVNSVEVNSSKVLSKEVWSIKY